jgi:hypothetical protein
VTEFQEFYPKGGKKSTKQEYYKNHQEKILEYQKSWRGKNYKITRLNVSRQRAKRKNIPFDLTIEDIPDMPNFCPILGIPLFYGDDYAKDNSPSLDRLVPEKGYVKGNVTWMSHRANTLKSNGTAEEHRLIADWMEENGL